MNEYFKRDSTRRRGTKWFLCPLYKPVSHPAASRTLVSHKSKAASLCWEGELSTGKFLCIHTCFQEGERERGFRQRADRKSVRQKTEVQVVRKRVRKTCGQEFLKWELVLFEPADCHLYVLISEESESDGCCRCCLSTRNNFMKSSSQEKEEEKNPPTYLTQNQWFTTEKRHLFLVFNLSSKTWINTMDFHKLCVCDG